MRHDTSFAVRYLTEDPVPIRDIIESLQGIETLLGEARQFLPEIIPGLDVERIELKVREIAQESPLREVFFVSLFLAFQKDLEHEIPSAFQSLTGHHIPPNFDTIFTLVVMILLFYGVGAIRDLVIEKAVDGPANRMLDGLISDLANDTGKDPDQIKDLLKKRYASDKTLWKRIANATSRFFAPSKRQHSAPIELNDRAIPHEVVRDVPAQYLVDSEADAKPARDFRDIVLELHAQDRDHAGRGWAAIPKGVTDRRLRLRLMDEVSTTDLWGHDVVRGDVTVVYEKIGVSMEPKEIHLHRVTGVGRA